MPGETSSAYREGRPAIEDAKALQKFVKKGDYHIVWFDAEGFVMAHTDWERGRIILTECDLHIKLSEADVMPVDEPGWYMWLPTWDKFALVTNSMYGKWNEPA